MFSHGKLELQGSKALFTKKLGRTKKVEMITRNSHKTRRYYKIKNLHNYKNQITNKKTSRFISSHKRKCFKFEF